MKKFIFISCVTSLLLSQLLISPTSAAPAKKAKGSSSDVVITVGGTQKIKRGQIDTLGLMMLKQREASNQGAVDIGNLNRMIANNLIGQELLDLEGKKTGVVASPKEVDSIFNGFKANFGSDQQFKAALQAAGDNEKSLKNKVIRQIKSDKLLNKQLTPIQKPTDKDMQDFFNANKSSFPIDDSMRASQIVLLQTKDNNGLEKKKQLEQLRAELIKDSNDIFLLLRKFTQYAMQASETPEKNTGGDLHLFKLKDFSTEFEKGVGGVQVGKISPVIKTPLGYHIVLVTEKHDGRFQSYRFAIAQAVATQQTMKNTAILRKYLQGLASKYPVVYIDKSFRDTSAMSIYSSK